MKFARTPDSRSVWPNAKVKQGILYTAIAGFAGTAVLVVGIGANWVANAMDNNNRARAAGIRQEVIAAQLDTAHRIHAHEDVAFMAGVLSCSGFDIENPLVRNIEGLNYYGFVANDSTDPNKVKVVYVNPYDDKCTLGDNPANTIGTGGTYDALLSQGADEQSAGPFYGKDAKSPDTYSHNGSTSSDGSFVDKADHPVPIGLKFEPRQ